MIVVLPGRRKAVAGEPFSHLSAEQKMLRINGTDVPKKRWWLAYLFGGLVVASAAVAEQTQNAAAIEAAKGDDAGRTTYRVINLGAGGTTVGNQCQRSGRVYGATRTQLTHERVVL